MKKLYLHMGFHKTATSSFQATCKANVSRLGAQGVSYPLFNSEQIKQSNIENHSIPIFSVFTEHPEIYHMNIRWKVGDIEGLNDDYLVELERNLLLDKDIIISGEGISLLTIQALSDLKRFIEKFNFLIVPLVVVKSPYEFHCSQTQQLVKSGTETSLVNFASQINKIKVIRKVFPNTEFIPFEKTCEHKLGPVGFLFDWIGINFDGFSFIKANEGVSNVHVRTQVLVNNDSPVIVDGHINDDWRSVRFKGSDYFKSRFLLTKDEMAQIKTEFDKENDFFDKHLGENFKDKTIRFSNESLVYGELTNYIFNGEALQNMDADYLRDAAVLLESIDLNISVNLMRLALKARPNGPYIKRKLAEYEKALEKTESPH